MEEEKKDGRGGARVGAGVKKLKLLLFLFQVRKRKEQTLKEKIQNSK